MFRPAKYYRGLFWLGWMAQTIETSYHFGGCEALYRCEGHKPTQWAMIGDLIL